jgi:ATP-dependent DNA helicase RecG
LYRRRVSSPEHESKPKASLPPLLRPVTTLWGVGPERAVQFTRLGIHTVEDLLLHRPRRYEDRRKFLPIRALEKGMAATVRGTVVAAGIKRWKHGTRSMFECILDDGTSRLHCRWWQAYPWMEEYYVTGREFMVYGKVESLRPRTVDHPETEPVETGEEEFIHVNRIVPVHPLTEGLTARTMRGIIWRALEQSVSGGWFREAEGVKLPERLPDNVRLAPDTTMAIRQLHFPDETEDAERARRRLALNEFIALQRGVLERRKKFEASSKGLPCGGDNRHIKPFLTQLGFKLTDAQTRVLREIRESLRGAHPMRRLLQGDVGSGKTAVAACAALMTVESGFNVALMAPTEILAEQHYRNFKRWLEPLSVAVELRTGSFKAGEHRGLRGEAAAGASSNGTRNTQQASLTIGTHALLTGGFSLPNLGLVIIDEQHKFGTAQREALVRKGNYPHLLVMTATPIPRTLGLTLYGDLDLSTIDALPAGRGRVRTFVRMAEALPKVWEFIREKLQGGRQAYVVYPRVDDDAGNVKAVVREFEQVQKALAPFRVGLLHGRLPAREKESVMAGFRANQVQVLLATSLIEVGVDVPNATVMLIENAENFGLAQLHQLRGRIGRGAHESFCVLMSNTDGLEARARLKVLEETNDGFKIAEADLKLRGPGELLGQQQSGAARFRFGDLAQDLDLIQLSRDLVRGGR